MKIEGDPLRRRWWWSLLVNIEGDPLKEEEAVFTRESITKEDPSNALIAGRMWRPRMYEGCMYFPTQTTLPMLSRAKLQLRLLCEPVSSISMHYL